MKRVVDCRFVHTLAIGSMLLFSTMGANANALTDSLLKEYGASVDEAFSAEAGEIFWNKDNDGRSCTSCHTDSLLVKGRHERTGKVIEPMALSINPDRFTVEKKINKWFLRNCKWTIGRECTTQEKGDILLWISQQ